MKIAVIGASGFVGTELSEYAIENGHEIVGISHTAPRINSDQFQFINLSNPTVNIRTAISQCDAAVVLAGKRPDGAFSREDYLFNIRIAAEYFDLCAESGITNIVFTSSRAVYRATPLSLYGASKLAVDGLLPPWREDEATPLSLYGASKLAVDGLLLYLNSVKGLHIKSLRLAQVIGQGERKGYLINTMVDNAVAKRTQTVYGSGEGRRQYIYIKDVCRAILTALANQEIGGIFNIGMKKNYSIIELARCVNKIFDNQDRLVYSDEKGEDLSCDLMDVTKAKDVLGFEADFDLEAAFRDLYSQIKGTELRYEV